MPRKKPEVRQLFKCPRCDNRVEHLADVPAVGILCKTVHRYKSGKRMTDDEEAWMEPVQVVRRRSSAGSEAQ